MTQSRSQNNTKSNYLNNFKLDKRSFWTSAQQVWILWVSELGIWRGYQPKNKRNETKIKSALYIPVIQNKMEETKCHPKRLLKDHKAAALKKQMKELNLADKTGSHIAAWKIIHSLCSGKNARRVMITPCLQGLYLSRETTLVHLLATTVVWFHWKKPPTLMKI